MTLAEIKELPAGIELDTLVSTLALGIPIADPAWPCGIDYESGVFGASNQKPTKFKRLYPTLYPVVGGNAENGKLEWPWPLPKYSHEFEEAVPLLGLPWFDRYALIAIGEWDRYQLTGQPFVEKGFAVVLKGLPVAKENVLVVADTVPLVIARAAAWVAFYDQHPQTLPAR